MKRSDLAGKTVVLLGSGGLDSITITNWLSRAGVKVIVMTGDLGQPEEKDMEDIRRRFLAAGAEEAILVDCKPLLVSYGMQAVQGLAAHEGGYMNTTGIGRMALVAMVLPEMQKRGILTLVHGATGRGNDQVRFELGPAMLAPQVQVYAPWRDQAFLDKFPGRAEMIKYCEENGLEVNVTREKPYSTDSNLLGLTHEAGKLEDISIPPDFVEYLMGAFPTEAPDKIETVSLSFFEGYVTAVNGNSLINQVAIFDVLNSIAGRNGIGIGTHVVENRRVGIKSRGIYEAPAMTLLMTAYAKLLELILDRNHRKLFDGISRGLADAIYEGEWFSPLVASLLNMTRTVAELVTGEITLGLYKGNIFFQTAGCVPHSLYDPENASMEGVGKFDHASSQGYLEIKALLARTMNAAGQTRAVN